ncbi:archease [bacterium]|nr:archease [bacterium]
MPERRVTYDTFSQGQQTGIELQAPSLQRIFIDAALALSDWRIALDLVKEESKETVALEATGLQPLLHAWLNACAALHSKKGFLPYRIVFSQFDGKKLTATLTGETYTAPRHGYPRPFTSVSADSLRLEELGGTEGGYSLKFLLG